MRSRISKPSHKAEREKIQQSITQLNKKIQIIMKFSPAGEARENSLASLKQKKAKLNEQLADFD